MGLESLSKRLQEYVTGLIRRSVQVSSHRGGICFAAAVLYGDLLGAGFQTTLTAGTGWSSSGIFSLTSSLTAA